MKPPILELQGVAKSFPGQAKPVLAGVNIAVAEGEFAVVVGCSGAGKTTLVSLAAGLLQPDAGAVVFDGKAATAPGPERAIVFQNYSLLPWLTVLENIRLAVEAASPSLSRSASADKARAFVELVRLGAASGKRPKELSGGMRQRVALARALAMEPKMLLLDEPLSALDALTRAALQDELASIWERARTTVIMVTNDIDEAILLADRVYPLTKGPAATLGRPIEIEVPRPRRRTHMSLLPEYQRARREIVGFLTHGTQPASAAAAQRPSAAKLVTNARLVIAGGAT